MAQRKAPNGPDNCFLSPRLIFWILRKSKATSRRMSGLPYAVSEQLRLPLLVAEDGRWPFFSPQAPESQLWSEAGFYHHQPSPTHYRIESKKSSNTCSTCFSTYLSNEFKWLIYHDLPINLMRFQHGFSFTHHISSPSLALHQATGQGPEAHLAAKLWMSWALSTWSSEVGPWRWLTWAVETRQPRWLEGKTYRELLELLEKLHITKKNMRNHPGPFSIAMWNYRRLCTEIGFYLFSPLKSKAFVSRTADAPPGKSQDV